MAIDWVSVSVCYDDKIIKNDLLFELWNVFVEMFYVDLSVECLMIDDEIVCIIKWLMYV